MMKYDYLIYFDDGIFHRAHHLTEKQFLTFAKPQADKIAAYLKTHHPNVPTVYFANGGRCVFPFLFILLVFIYIYIYIYICT